MSVGVGENGARRPPRPARDPCPDGHGADNDIVLVIKVTHSPPLSGLPLHMFARIVGWAMPGRRVARDADHDSLHRF